MRTTPIWTAAAALALALAGCASMKDLDTGLGSLVGKPAKAAVDRLGPPTNQIPDGADTDYVWGLDRDVPAATTAPPASYGESGDIQDFTKPQVVNTQTVNYRCTITVVVGADDRIKSFTRTGNIDGCSQFASRLR